MLKTFLFPGNKEYNQVILHSGFLHEMIAKKGSYMPIESMHITPDEIRDKELEDLRQKLSTAKRLGWLLLVLGLLLGVLISWAFSGIC